MPLVSYEHSRCPSEERLHVPGSPTTPGLQALAIARHPCWLQCREPCRHPVPVAFADQWLACAIPYRRFAPTLVQRHRRPLTLDTSVRDKRRHARKGYAHRFPLHRHSRRRDAGKSTALTSVSLPVASPESDEAFCWMCLVHQLYDGE